MLRYKVANASAFKNQSTTMTDTGRFTYSSPGQIRLLIVEDNEEDLQLILGTLRQSGYKPQYRQVVDAPGLILALEEEDWHLILADHVLARFSALAALNVLQERGYDIPLIIVSDDIGEKGALAAMQAGAHDYVVKNDIVRLVGAVRREIAEAAVRREREEKQKYLDQLNQITYAAATILDDEQMLHTQANLLKKLLRADGVYISMWNAAAKRAFPAAAHEGMHKLYRTLVSAKNDFTVTSTVVETGRVLVVSDAENSAYVSRRLLQILPARSLLALPLAVGEQKLGAVIITFSELHTFSADEISRAEQATGQISLAMARTRLLAEERKQRELAETLREVAGALNSSLDREQVLVLILEQLQRVVAYDSASIMLLQEDVLQSVAFRSLNPQVEQAMELPVNDLMHIQQMLEMFQPLIIADTAVDARWQQAPETNLIRCWMGVPMMIQDRIVGILNLNHTEPGFYGAVDAQMATTFAGQAAIAIENARLYAQQRAYAAELEQRVSERTQELALANTRLQELDRLKSKFVSDVTHELRTPVTSLKLYLDLMQQVSGEKRERYIQVVRSQADRLGTLIADILSLSKLEQEKTAVSFSALNFNQVVLQVVQQYRPQAQAASLHLECETAPELPPVLGHKTQIEQVVTNLLVNAINYTAKGGIWVTTTWDEEQEMVLLTVKDTGMGILDHERPFLFDRFYRGERTGQLSKPGTGLGLAIVREIVELHQGKIEFESVVDDGSTFEVWLPPA